jgi:hypothetical protein
MGRSCVGTKGFWPGSELFVDSVHGAEGHDRLRRQPLPLRGVGVGKGGWGRDAYLSQAHLVAEDSDAKEAVAVEEEEDAQYLPRVELVQRLADGRNPRPEGNAKAPESVGVDNVEVFHLKIVFEVGDSTTESATKQSRRRG